MSLRAAGSFIRGTVRQPRRKLQKWLRRKHSPFAPLRLRVRKTFFFQPRFHRRFDTPTNCPPRTQGYPPSKCHIVDKCPIFRLRDSLGERSFQLSDGEPNWRMKGETLETKRENATDWPGSDARSSVGKHASGRLRSESGEPQMQRGARSQQVASPAAGTGRRKAEGFGQKRYGKPETARRSCGHGTARRKGTDKSACRGDQNQPPDGTGRQHGNLAMKAGPNGPPSSRERGVRAARVEQSSLKAPSGTAIAQVVRNQSRRAWGWWKHRPHLLLRRVQNQVTVSQ